MSKMFPQIVASWCVDIEWYLVLHKITHHSFHQSLVANCYTEACHIISSSSNVARTDRSSCHKTSVRNVSNLWLGGNSSLWICDLDSQSLCLCDDLDSLSRWNGVCDLGGVCSIVHEEQFDILCVIDEECFVARWHHVSSLLVGTETNLSFN